MGHTKNARGWEQSGRVTDRVAHACVCRVPPQPFLLNMLVNGSASQTHQAPTCQAQQHMMALSPHDKAGNEAKAACHHLQVHCCSSQHAQLWFACSACGASTHWVV